MTRAGVVSLDGLRVGRLEEIEAGTRFTYDPEWARRPGAAPVSLTLPVREAAYDAKGLHPFFEGLLPEGWLLEIATSKLKLSKDDALGILLATCADCVGAVEVQPA